MAGGSGISVLAATHDDDDDSNSCCSCSFEPEIIKIGQASHKMDSNNILNFQESTTILNARTKNVWKYLVCTSYIYIYIYISVTCSSLLVLISEMKLDNYFY